MPKYIKFWEHAAIEAPSFQPRIYVWSRNSAALILTTSRKSQAGIKIVFQRKLRFLITPNWRQTLRNIRKVALFFLYDWCHAPPQRSESNHVRWLCVCLFPSICRVDGARFKGPNLERAPCVDPQSCGPPHAFALVANALRWFRVCFPIISFWCLCALAFHRD